MPVSYKLGFGTSQGTSQSLGWFGGARTLLLGESYGASALPTLNVQREVMGRWLWRGYLHTGGYLVGRWRDTFTAEHLRGELAP